MNEYFHNINAFEIKNGLPGNFSFNCILPIHGDS